MDKAVLHMSPESVRDLWLAVALSRRLDEFKSEITETRLGVVGEGESHAEARWTSGPERSTLLSLGAKQSIGSGVRPLPLCADKFSVLTRDLEFWMSAEQRNVLWLEPIREAEVINRAITGVRKAAPPDVGALTAGIKRLVEAGRVREARQVLRKALEADQSNEALHAWARVLAEPKVWASERATGRDLRPDAEWLRKHAREYRAQWVAIRHGSLLDADRSRVALHRRLKSLGHLAGALFVRIPD